MLDDDGGGDGDGDPLGKTKSKTKRRPRPVVRETLEITSWGAGKIEATPHGYFAKLMDEAKPPAGDKGKSKTFESNIPFDHYLTAKTKIAKSQNSRRSSTPLPSASNMRARSSQCSGSTTRSSLKPASSMMDGQSSSGDSAPLPSASSLPNSASHLARKASDVR